MSTIQRELEQSNAEYASAFTKGQLPLPPGKKYLVCKFNNALPTLAQQGIVVRWCFTLIIGFLLLRMSSNMHGRSH